MTSRQMEGEGRSLESPAPAMLVYRQYFGGRRQNASNSHPGGWA